MRGCFKPTLDILEDRTVPTVTLGFTNGIAVFTGNGQNDSLTIEASIDNGDRIMTATYNGKNGITTNVINLETTALAGISVSLGSGKDKFTFTDLNAFDLEQSFKVWVDLGSGNDTAIVQSNTNITGEGTVVNLDIYGRDGQDDINVQFAGNLAAGAALSTVIDGGNQNDTIFLAQSGLSEGNANFWLVGGQGDDSIRSSFFAAAPDEEGATGNLKVTVEGGSGYNSLTLLAGQNETASLNTNLKILSTSKDGVYFTDGVFISGAVKAENWHPFPFHDLMNI